MHIEINQRASDVWGLFCSKFMELVKLSFPIIVFYF